MRSPQPGDLGSVASSRSSELRFLDEAFDRLCREYPWTRDGLSLTQRRILAAAWAASTTPRPCSPASGRGKCTPQLRRRIAGVSQKMLTQTLRELERDGLLTRRVEATVPVTVEYSLTERGHTLVEPLKALKDWAECHIEGIQASRAAFDGAAAA